LLNIRLLCTWILEPIYRHYKLQASLRVPDICLALTRHVIVNVTSSAQMLNRKLQWQVVSLFDCRFATNALDMPLTAVGRFIFSTNIQIISFVVKTCRQIFWNCSTGEIRFSFSSMGNNILVTVTWNRMTAMFWY